MIEVDFWVGEFVLEVTNFMKHNDQNKTSQWFKLRNDWFEDPRLSDLTPTARYVFVVLCSLRATSGGPIGNLTVTSLQRRCNLPGRSLKPILLTLWKKGLISLDRLDKKEKIERERGCAPVQPLFIKNKEEKPELKPPPPPTEKNRKAIPELHGKPAEEIADYMTVGAQAALYRDFGEQLFFHAPYALQSFLDSPPDHGSFGKYLRSWLENEKKKGPRMKNISDEEKRILWPLK